MEYVLGFLIASAVGLTGVGAGSVTAPILILFFHLKPAVAVGTALTFAAVIKLAVLPIYLRRHRSTIGSCIALRRRHSRSGNWYPGAQEIERGRSRAWNLPAARAHHHHPLVDQPLSMAAEADCNSFGRSLPMASPDRSNHRRGSRYLVCWRRCAGCRCASKPHTVDARAGGWHRYGFRSHRLHHWQRASFVHRTLRLPHSHETMHWRSLGRGVRRTAVLQGPVTCIATCAFHLPDRSWSAALHQGPKLNAGPICQINKLSTGLETLCYAATLCPTTLHFPS